MKNVLLIVVISMFSCKSDTEKKLPGVSANPLVGTWQLVTGTLIIKGDTTITDYTKGTSFVKIINNTHFAFLKHDLNKGKDSAAAFVAGGGRYSLHDSVYREHLEYCSARDWEGNDFDFAIHIKNDTLVQQGVEKVASLGVDRINIERYSRVK